MSLYCLVYTSVAKYKMTDENLQTILKNSDFKYKTLNVNGVLLYQNCITVSFWCKILEIRLNKVGRFNNDICFNSLGCNG